MNALCRTFLAPVIVFLATLVVPPAEAHGLSLQVLSYPAKRTKDGVVEVRTRVVKTGGVRELSDSPLLTLWQIDRPDHQFRVLTSDPEHVERFGGKSIEEEHSKLVAGPLAWARGVLVDRFNRPLPKFELEVVLLPESANFQRDFRHLVTDDVFTLTVAEAVREEPTFEHLVAQSMALGVDTFLHELIHQLSMYGAPYEFRTRNRISEEAIAYAFGACSLLSTGALIPIMVPAGIPLAPETARAMQGVPSREVLRKARVALRDQVGRLKRTQQGSILAGLALAEGSGLRSRFGSADENDAFGRFCSKAIDPQYDWLDLRPCQRPELADFCMPSQAPGSTDE